MKGLVLSGGKSSRMGSPKAEINYHGEPEYVRCAKLLGLVCDNVYLSTSEFWTPPNSDIALLPDTAGASSGPLSGIATAFCRHPDSAWMVLACDVPFFNEQALRELLSQRDALVQATCFIGHQDRPEPLCAIYESSAAPSIMDAIAQEKYCARGVLESMSIKRIFPRDREWVRNINRRDELSIDIEVQYVAQLREVAGLSKEKLNTSKLTPRALYEDLSQRHGFLLRPQHMRVAINDEMAQWDTLLRAHDRVLFVPPVAGG